MQNKGQGVCVQPPKPDPRHTFQVPSGSARDVQARGESSSFLFLAKTRRPKRCYGCFASPILAILTPILPLGERFSLPHGPGWRKPCTSPDTKPLVPPEPTSGTSQPSRRATCGELTPLGGQAELSLPALCFKKLMKSWACAREWGRAPRCLPAKAHIPLTFQRVSFSYSSALPWGQSLRPGGGRSLLKVTLASQVCSIPAPGSLPGSRQRAGTLSQPAMMSAAPEITFRTQNISLHHSANISSCKRNKEARRAE